MVNWLVLLVGKIKNNVIEKNKFIKFFSRQLDEKVDMGALEELQQKFNNLEKECDEVRQRNMKGNIIISSPTLRDGERRRVTHQEEGGHCGDVPYGHPPEDRRLRPSQ